MPEATRARRSLSQPNTLRSLALFGAGAVLGLGLAGYALFTAKGTTTGAIPPEDIALVNERPILRSDFANQIQTETGAAYKDSTPAQRRKVLGEMVDEELLVQRGLDVDLAASDPDVRAALVAGVDLQVDAEVLAQQPTDAELAVYYQVHRDRYASDGVMQLRDLVIAVPAGGSPDAAMAAARNAVAALRQGDAVDDVARDNGLADSGKLDHGDNFDFGVQAKLGEALYAAAETLSTGEVGEPIARPDGVHVLVMVKRKAPVQRDLAAARDTVWQDLKRDQRTAVEQGNLAYLKGKAEILLAPEYRP